MSLNGNISENKVVVGEVGNINAIYGKQGRKLLIIGTKSQRKKRKRYKTRKLKQ